MKGESKILSLHRELCLVLIDTRRTLRRRNAQGPQRIDPYGTLYSGKLTSARLPPGTVIRSYSSGVAGWWFCARGLTTELRKVWGKTKTMSMLGEVHNNIARHEFSL